MARLPVAVVGCKKQGGSHSPYAACFRKSGPKKHAVPGYVQTLSGGLKPTQKAQTLRQRAKRMWQNGVLGRLSDSDNKEIARQKGAGRLV